MPLDMLADTLRKMYGTVLTKKGKEYSRSGLINLRAGLNRYLQDPPYKRTLDLMNDQIFLQANKVFTGRLRDNKEKGLDSAKARQAIDQEDLENLFKNYLTPGLKIGDTKVLLHKIFFDVVYYTGRRGKEGLRSLSKTSFNIKKGSDGQDFIEINFNEKSKKNQGDESSSSKNALHNDHHIISAQPGNILCPVETFKTYVGKLNHKCDAFFQYYSKDRRDFENMPVGKNSLATLMKEISKEANLSKTYTNHCIRKTTATALHRKGFGLNDIKNVTKHKNIDSLKHYIGAPTYKEKQNYNSALLSYAENNNEERTTTTKRHSQKENRTSKNYAF